MWIFIYKAIELLLLSLLLGCVLQLFVITPPGEARFHYIIGMLLACAGSYQFLHPDKPSEPLDSSSLEKKEEDIS